MPKSINNISDCNSGFNSGVKVLRTSITGANAETINDSGAVTDFSSHTVRIDIESLPTVFGVRGNIWNIGIGKNKSTKDECAFEHPAIFPEKLAFDHIKTWTNEGDLVYDCFMGSGTTAKAAIAANRKYIGSEISEEYCKIIDKRLEPMLNNLFTNL